MTATEAQAKSPRARAAVDVREQRLARPAAAMAIGTALSRLTGFGRVAAMAFALGVAESRLADSYNIANTLPNVLYELVLGGILSSVFVPVLVQQLRTKEHGEAWRSISAIVTSTMGALLAVSVLVFAAAPWIINLFTGRASGPDAEAQRELATFFLRFFAPQVALYGVAAVAEGLLNAHGRFAAPMFVPIVNNMVVIASFVAFALVTSGVPTNAAVQDSESQKLILAIGTTGGVAAMALALWPFVRTLPGRLTFRVDLRDPALARVVRLSLWTVVYVALNAVGFAISFFLANGQQGGPTAYIAAFAFFQLPVGVVAVSIVNALTPRLSAFHVDGARAGFRASIGRGMRGIVLVLAPATAFYLIFAPQLIDALLRHGIVGQESSQLVSSVLRCFSIGLIPFAAYMLLTRAFYARQDARTPALVNVAENAVTIGLDFALYPAMKVQGLALAHSLGYFAGTALVAVLLSRRLGGLRWRATWRSIGPALACIAASVCTMVAVQILLGDAVNDAALPELGLVAAGGLAGVAAFLAVARLVHLPELSSLRTLVSRRRGSG